jgi:hypothetical protein
MKRFFPIALFALAFTSCAPKQPPPAAPPATQSAWHSLSNGQDLTGWRPMGSAGWRVDHKDGWPDMIVGGQDGDPKRSGNLVTVDQFQNFELELEFMIAASSSPTRREPRPAPRRGLPKGTRPTRSANRSTGTRCGSWQTARTSSSI